jgi:hypothetical protein
MLKSSAVKRERERERERENFCIVGLSQVPVLQTVEGHLV